MPSTIVSCTIQFLEQDYYPMLLNQLGVVSVTSRRTLFKKLKEVPKIRNVVKEEVDTKHHEYSIRPDTFAFKVSADLTSVRGKETSTRLSQEHPLQKNEKGETSGFNLLEYIYKNATNYPFHNHSPQDVFDRYPMTNSARMGRLKHRPSKAKMLASDFIEDSLYNPTYGYFSKEVEIFHNDQPFDYRNIEDVDEFMDAWQKAYAKYDEVKPGQQVIDPIKEFEQTSKSSSQVGLAKHAQMIHRQDLVATGGPAKTKKSMQLWHTPTELFSPYYGEALARYIVVNYKLNGSYPYEDLIIFEMGGGNGTLMCNILNYIKTHEPDIYKRTQYKIIEISSQLALKQFSLAMKQKLVAQNLDGEKLEIINKSIFKWDKTVDQPCFFIALEVFDNFAHDLVRYDATTGEPYEGYVLVDEEGDFYEFFAPELSYYTNAFLNLRESGKYPVLPQAQTMAGRLKTLSTLIPYLTDKESIHPLLHSSTGLSLRNRFAPFKDNLTPGEFVPTRLLQFFQILKHRFPNHSLVSSDFHSLPNSINGYYNAPVVQTIIQDKMVDVSTYMCHQGYFDIMFPTDFDLASDLYRKVTGKLAKVELHQEFLEKWADVELTTTKKGENPMLDFYKNVSFMVS